MTVPAPAADATPPLATARRIDGRVHADAVLDDVAAAVAEHVGRGHRAPTLATVLVGVDPASRVYIGAKHRACARTGIRSVHFELPFETTQAELEQLVDRLNADAEIDGILVQLPLPPHCQADPLLDRLRADKDVDGFHPTNIGLLAQKRPGLRPCTPWGVMEMLRREGIDPAGMDAVVVGASNIVGRPMALELLLARATVTVCHSATRDLVAVVSRADLVVAAVGRAGFVPGAWIKPGAVVIDVGINRGADGKLTGDVEYAAAAARAGAITPVPGGVGPMTVAMLMKNTLTAARHAATPKALHV